MDYKPVSYDFIHQAGLLVLYSNKQCLKFHDHIADNSKDINLVHRFKKTIKTFINFFLNNQEFVSWRGVVWRFYIFVFL